MYNGNFANEMPTKNEQTHHVGLGGFFFGLPYTRLLQVLTDQFLLFKRTSGPTSNFLQNFEKTSHFGSKICF
jgi:hypothetical protein